LESEVEGVLMRHVLLNKTMSEVRQKGVSTYLTPSSVITLSVHVICEMEEEARLLNVSQYVVSISRQHT
jgi:hypothetical protein